MASSACFLTAPGTASLVVILPTMAWGYSAPEHAEGSETATSTETKEQVTVASFVSM